MVRIKDFPEKNYKSFFTKTGKTLRIQYDYSKPILELDYPELYDIGLGTLCYGNCDYCYISANKHGKNFENIIEKAKMFFGSMNDNQKPYQVAIGGSSEPTLHPDFCKFVKTIYELNIVPNYTTNGMHLVDEILEVTEKYCGGVALTCHSHLDKIWQKGIDKLKNITRLNLHLIISNKESVDRFVQIFKQYKDVIEYFVLLPYQAIGYAKETNLEYQYLLDELRKFEDLSQISFGAMFYPLLLENKWLNLSLYEPHHFSKYISFEGNMSLYKSSFEWQNPIKINLLENKNVN